MSNSVRTSGHSDGEQAGMPRAHVHKNILEVAESRPDDSMEEIARTVTGASTSLVERVLEEFGDPAVADSSGERSDTTEKEIDTDDNVAEATDGRFERENESDDSDDSREADVIPTRAQLTRKQLQTVRAIYENEEATQGELAAKLDVSRAAICQRVNGIDGFDWERRSEFVSRMFDGAERVQEGRSRDDREIGLTDRIRELDRRLARIEKRVDTGDAGGQIAITDPELVGKVIHACFDSPQITQEEELRIIRTILQPGSNGE